MTCADCGKESINENVMLCEECIEESLIDFDMEEISKIEVRNR